MGHGLTEAGRQRLREAARRNKPWLKSTGPRTPGGKAISSQNALKHGRDTDQARAHRRRALKVIDAIWKLHVAIARGTYSEEACRYEQELKDFLVK